MQHPTVAIYTAASSSGAAAAAASCGYWEAFFLFFIFDLIFIFFSPRSMNFFSPRARSFSALLRLATLVLRCTHARAFSAALKGGS